MTKKRIGTVLTIMLLIAVVRYCLNVEPLTPAQLQIELSHLDIVDDIRDEIEFLRTYDPNDEDTNDIQALVSVLLIIFSPLTFAFRLIVFTFRIIGFTPLTTPTPSTAT